MLKNLLRISFVFLLVSLMFTSCKKDKFEPDTQQEDYATTSIKASIPRIVENNQGGINVFVNVTDQNGKAITNLDVDNFKFEIMTPSGQTQTMTPSGSTQNPSLIITALTMDYSGSMYTDSTSIPAMENAISTFLGLKAANDYAEIIKFSDTLQVTVPLTDSLSLLQAGLIDTTFVGMNTTALYAAMQVGADDVVALANTNPTYLPSVVGFTDGKNNQPPLTADTLIQNCIVDQIPIYTVGYGVAPDTAQLKNISSQTGGQFFWNPGTANMNTVYQHINGQLVNTTIIPLPGPSSKGHVTVKVTASYEAAVGVLKAIAEKEFYY